MVIRDDGDAPLEMSIAKTPKKYVNVKSHARESEQATSGHSSAQDDAWETQKRAKRVKTSSHKDIKVMPVKTKQNARETACSLHKDVLKELQDIRKQVQDFQNEMREFVREIKETVNQMKIKPECSTNVSRNSQSEPECNCKLNTKILFNEDGQQIVTEPSPDHMCMKKLKRKYSDVAKNIDIHSLAMQQGLNLVETVEEDIPLPEDLKSLSNILVDSEIALSYRNKVIDKVRLMRQEHVNEIRFNRPSLIEKLKSKPDSGEVFEFKGANLFSLSGYPDWK